MKLTDVIRRPLITEKTSIQREDGRTIVFHVAPNANKTEIKRAIEQLLGSKVESVRTSIAHGKVNTTKPGKYGDDATLGTLTDGDHLGHAMLNNADTTWPYTATAMTPAPAIRPPTASARKSATSTSPGLAPRPARAGLIS